MSSNENLHPIKLRKIVLNKFLRFKYVEIDFRKFESISGKSNSAKALPMLVEGFKFVFDCSETSLEKLQYVDDDEDAMETDDDSM
jgi:hypothetical protein